MKIYKNRTKVLANVTIAPTPFLEIEGSNFNPTMVVKKCKEFHLKTLFF